MGNSYVRQSAADIQTGNIVEADPINAEFNALQSAFDASAGHSHDGTVGEGQKISLTSSIVGVLPVANGGYGGVHNNSASTDPGVTNDSSQGYSVGSVWINTTAKSYFVCTDNTLGAAVWNSFQLVDSALGSIAGLTTTANQTIYTTGSDTYATTSLTAYGRSLIDDADAATARGTLGLGTIATQNSNSVTITGGAITGTPISGSTVAGTTGTFSGNVSGVAGTFSGAVSGTTGTFSGTITTGGNTVWHAGNLTPANYAPLAGATFTGGISGTTASFSGSVTASGQAVWHAGNLTPSNYLPLTGGTLSDFLTLHANPTNVLHATPKQYVDGSVTGKNALINADMTAAQRGTSFATPTSGVYTLDRWFITWAGAAPTSVAQITGLSGFSNAMRITGRVGNTQTTISQRIRSVNSARFIGLQAALSATLQASVGQTILWQLAYANAADNFSGATAIASGTWTATTSYQRFSAILSALPAGAANGLQLSISPQNGGAFTSGTFDLTGVQLETGNVATAFEAKSFETNLSECMDYGEPIPGIANGAYGAAGNTFNFTHKFMKKKRGTVTIPALSFSTANLSACTGAATTDGTGVTVSVTVNALGAFGYQMTGTPFAESEL